MEIATARVEDSADVAALISGVYAPFAEQFRPTALRWTTATVAACHVDWLLARSEGQLVGVVHHLPDQEGYTLDALAVRADRRRQAVASRLLDEVETRAAGAGAAQIIIALPGFAPGFGYLSGGDPALVVPRRGSPRTRVPVGALGLAGEFTGIYPRPGPGGWQLIGRTDAAMWDLDRTPAAMLRPGVRVTFRAVPT